MSPWLLVFLIFGSACHLSDSSSIDQSGKGEASFSPIKELGPSLAASVAGGTVIAVRSRALLNSGKEVSQNAALRSINSNDEYSDCIVILFRSLTSSNESYVAGGGANNLTVSSVYEPITNPQNQQEELSPLFNGPTNHPFLSSNTNNARILHARTGLILTATGFKPDISHLTHVASGRILSRTSTYDTSNKSLDPHRIVREDLSNILIDAAASDGGRPMGVQLLVVGQSCISQGLELYTIDPSGGWRSHVGQSAVVGRGAERVRTALMKKRQISKLGNIEQRGWKLALERAMFAAIDSFEFNEGGVSALAADEESRPKSYCAIVVFAGSRMNRKIAVSNTRCAAIHPEQVQDSYKRCYQHLLLERNLADSHENEE